MGLFNWHFGVTVGRRRTYRLGPFARLSIGWKKHFGRPQRRRRR